MDGKTLNYIWEVRAEHALFRKDGKWYHHLVKFPGALFDENGFILFPNDEDYKTCPYLQHGKNLHIPLGISSIPGYIKIINDGNNEFASYDINNEVNLAKRQVSIFIRNKLLVERVKEIHSNACQICGLRLQIFRDRYYSEVHHIKPLGKPHFGPDRIDNMLCVCPNHHVLLDFGSIPIESNSIKSKQSHLISEEYIDYHNKTIYKTIGQI